MIYTPGMSAEIIERVRALEAKSAAAPHRDAAQFTKDGPFPSLAISQAVQKLKVVVDQNLAQVMHAVSEVDGNEPLTIEQEKSIDSVVEYAAQGIRNELHRLARASHLPNVGRLKRCMIPARDKHIPRA